MSLPLAQYPIPADYDELARAYKDLVKLHVQSQKQHVQELQFYKDKPKFLAAELFAAKADGVVVSWFYEAELAAEDEGEHESKTEGIGKPRRKNRKTIPDYLPRNIIEHERDENQKACSADGTKLVKIHKEVDYIPAKIVANQHVYLIFSCPYCASGVHKAQTTKRVIPGSVALIAQVDTQKYLDYPSIHGQAQIFARSGQFIARANLSAWMIKIGGLLLPITNIMFDDLLRARALQCDETPNRVLKLYGIATSKKCYTWSGARRGPRCKIIYYEFDQTRSGKVPCLLFPEYVGCLQVDGHNGYDKLLVSYLNIKPIGYMARVRRGFTDPLKTMKNQSRASHSSKKIVKAIGQLYDVEEKPCVQDSPLSNEVRLSDAAAIFDSLQEMITAESSAGTSCSLYEEAVVYAAKELGNTRPRLGDGHAEIDNNLIENTIRPFCMRRRNWLFADTESGAQASATIYTIPKTARAIGHELARFLGPYCNELVDFEPLLPYTKVS